ncbi:hypothetical protein PUNSTDRAFT_44881 [Punctularia strigosozonata HHB-11173 SS5]|uniref:uncharacterized protein n=1 Tax=Punctularia strigosozonata (strain HHB-11173) TaxID=741275 RepID=UPI0004418219|nr:uncharacterized protein PUNSTDRAFT_44881 [Punctularia strigosozonata HHB-11173 SS5]EIN08357.1 hypothetical protein PUNSTDRAFT_44881 [Punctularia strigosozonata HHB-11173 SS5]
MGLFSKKSAASESDFYANKSPSKLKKRSSSASASSRNTRRSNDYANDAYAGPESVKTGGTGSSTYPASENGVAARDYGAASNDVVGGAPAAYNSSPTSAAYGSQAGAGAGGGYRANNDYADNGVGERSGLFGRGKSTRRNNNLPAIGSNDVRNQLMAKEAELQAIKMQAAELAEAERLEHEAMQRRERAVGLGAHQANRTLGAGMV